MLPALSHSEQNSWIHLNTSLKSYTAFIGKRSTPDVPHVVRFLHAIEINGGGVAMTTATRPTLGVEQHMNDSLYRRELLSPFTATIVCM